MKTLSKYQIEILELLDKGKTSKEIADILLVETSTVSWHLNKIYKAFKVHDRQAAIRVAKELGFILA